MFETQFVQSLLDEKWAAVYWVMLLQAGAYFIYVVTVTMYTTLYTHNIVFRTVVLGLTAVYFV